MIWKKSVFMSAMKKHQFVKLFIRALGEVLFYERQKFLSCFDNIFGVLMARIADAVLMPTIRKQFFASKVNTFGHQQCALGKGKIVA